MSHPIKRKMCKECPFKRDSIPGYLGAASGDPKAFLDPHWNGVTRLPCHMKVNWEKENSQELAKKAPLCQGFLTMCKNSAKMPLNIEAANEVSVTERNVDDVFNWLPEFMDHHKLSPTEQMIRDELDEHETDEE